MNDRIRRVLPGVLAVSIAVAAAAAETGEQQDEESVPRPAEGIELDAASGTVTGALQGKEGVRIQTMCTHCNSANVQVGGLNQDLVPIFRDGYPLMGGLATSFVLSVLPADSVAEASVVKGPGGAREPSAAAGGSIALTEAQAEEVPWIDFFAETGSYDLRNGALRFAGPMASWLSGTAVVGGTSASPVDDDGDGWNDVGALDREYAEARLGFEAGRDHSFDIGGSWISEDTEEARGAYDYTSDIGGGPAPAWTREDTFVDRAEFRAGWEWRLPRGGQLDLRLLQADRDQSVHSQITQDPASPFGEFFERFRISDEGRWGSIGYGQPLGRNWMFQTGVEADELQVAAETIPDPAATPTEVVDYVETRSVFAGADWHPAPKWSLELGLRYEDLEWGGRDLAQSNEESVWLPRATLRYAPGAAWKLRLSAGKTARAPKPIFSEVCCGQNYERSINTDAETAITLGFEGLFQPSPKFRTSLYLARSDFDDYILRLVGSSFYYVQTYTLGNVPEARAETAEIAVNWSATRWLNLDASAGWSSFYNTGDTDVTVYVTPLFFTEPQPVVLPIGRIPYLPVRTGSIGAAFTLPRRILLSVQASYTGTMLIQQFNEDPLALPPPPEVPSILLKEMRETPGFWVANLSVQLPLGKGFDLVAALNNVSNEIQNDLGSPTTDYNWGPLAGRSWQFGLRYYLDRQ